MIRVKTRDEIAMMRRAGAATAAVRDFVKEQTRAGMTTLDLDKIAAEAIRRQKGKASFYGYAGFPGHICVSVNDEVVHGIPGGRVLQAGDLVSLDIGVQIAGFHGDSAVSFLVGGGSESAQRLIDVTEQSFWAGLEQAVPGNRIGDIGAAVQRVAEDAGYGVVRALTGHGIGRDLHEDPSVPNHGKPGKGDLLRPGMTICIEPMINEGTHRVYVLDNDWTVVTADGKLSSHYEHTIVITEGKPEILTIAD